MCGISGIISLHNELSDNDYSTVKKMSDSISHRGPDQQKTKRLNKIVDVLGTSKKPTANTPLFYIYDNGTVEKRINIE